MSIDLKEQYDKIYRYCWIRVHNREIAEDITQETFLRYLEKPEYRDVSKKLQLLYTIAGNLCKDHYKKPSESDISDYSDILEAPGSGELENKTLTNLALKQALASLSQDEREMVLLRYVNEVPVNVISEMYGISRFSVNRRLKGLLDRLKDALGEEGES